MGKNEDHQLLQLDKTLKMWRTAVEVLEPETVSVDGKFPDWLNGTYYRVGPGKLDFGEDFSMSHWMDGYALISKFSIDGQGQTVTFESKYLKSNSYQRAMRAQRPAVAEFGTPAYTQHPKGFFSRLLSYTVPEMSDNTNHSFFTLDGGHFGMQDSSTPLTLLTTNDSGFMHEVDPVTLDCHEHLDSNKFFGLNVCTPHPLRDDESSMSYNIGTSVVLTGLKYNLLQIPPPLKTNGSNYKDQLKNSKIICSISSQWTSYFSFNHSFGMTKHFIIFIEQPLAVNVTKLLTSSFRTDGESSRDWLEWKSESLNRFYLIDKATGRLINKNICLESEEPFFFLHFINSYEDPVKNEVVVDVTIYKDADILLSEHQLLSYARRSSTSPNNNEDNNVGDDLDKSPQSKRFVIPLKLFGIDISSGDQQTDTNHVRISSKKFIVVSKPIISEEGLELATINPSVYGKPYQFFYASGLMSQGAFRNTLCKIDTWRMEVMRFKISEYFIFGEPIFTSKGKYDEEDEGILIVPMTDLRKTEPDMLFFIDAKEMVEIGRVLFKNWIQPAIHGVFIKTMKIVTTEANNHENMNQVRKSNITQ